AAATTYATKAREMRDLRLADGAHDALSPLATLRVIKADAGPSHGAQRVLLEKGVAYFEIAGGAPAPFIVATPFGELQTRAADFAVRIDAHEAVLTVLTGDVAAHASSGRSLLAHLLGVSPSLALTAGHELQLGQPAAIAALSPAQTQNRLAWRDGHI